MPDKVSSEKTFEINSHQNSVSKYSVVASTPAKSNKGGTPPLKKPVK